MQRSQVPGAQGRTRLPRRRSAFASAFLSLLFPGLGHAYAGAWGRAVAFSAAPILAIALAAGLALRLRLELLGIVLQPIVLVLILVLDVALLLYRVAAAIDAHRTAVLLNAEDGGARPGRGGARVGLPSLLGLFAVLVVMTGGHAAVAYYDLQAADLVNCVFDSSGAAACDSSSGGDASGGTDASGGADASLPADASSGDAIGTAAPGATNAPDASLPPWNGKDRLNILLVGADQRPNQNIFNTDTMIVVSIDPTTGRVAMLQIPRDTVDLPLPPGPARSVFGSTYRMKINSLWTQAIARPDLFPGSKTSRGPNALKSTLGYLYGLDIRWYVQVNFEGFRQIVDTLGGVTVNVQIPVMDDHYPGEMRRALRLYIPAGIQHMDGATALQYARSRHGKNGVGSNDFDRGSRQQRVLVSLKDQTNFSTIVGQLPQLIAALKSAVHTDIPINQLPSLVQLASRVDSTDMRSFVFAPTYYQKEVISGDPRGYVIIPYVDRIRNAVKNAFASDPAAEANREALAAEPATVRIFNGSGKQGQASDLAAYLSYFGIDAVAAIDPTVKGTAKTQLIAWNGAETAFPETLKVLTRVLGATVVPKTDPATAADFTIVTSAATPNLTPPPGP